MAQTKEAIADNLLNWLKEAEAHYSNLGYSLDHVKAINDLVNEVVAAFDYGFLPWEPGWTEIKDDVL